jgi:hypothetical protein
MAGEIPSYTVSDIASRCGRGWYFAERPRAADSMEWQMARINNYMRVMDIAPSHIRDRDGMTDRTKAAIWAHVCAETDLRWKAEAAHGTRP